MADAPTNADVPLDERKRLPAWVRLVGWSVAGVTEAAALVWFIDRLSAGDLTLAGWVGQYLLAVALAVLGAWLAERRRRTLYSPLRKLEILLSQIRAGEAPIDELSQVGGRLAPLSAQVQSLLRELRKQQGELDSEVRQRIANRTSALERTVGSLRHLAARDGLTGLLNRRAFDDHITQAVIRCRAGGSPLSLLMIDVDHFKILNDTFGHAVGDELLKSIAQIVRSSIRDTDHAFRWGGDEFAVLLEGADADAGRALADRLISLVDALGKTYRIPTPPRLSIGVANLLDLPIPSAQAIIEAADKLLYEVKASRRTAPKRAAS